ncbi:MAG: DUF6069 family protein [Chloroflexota bacterium]
MATQGNSSKAQTHESINPRRIWLAGLVGVVASVITNLVARMVLFVVLPLPAEFPPLQAGTIAIFTAAGTLMAAVVYALIARFTRRPVTVFRWVAFVALILSILPNLALVANPGAIPFPFPGASGLAFGVLIVFHLLAALVCVVALTSLSREKR